MKSKSKAGARCWKSLTALTTSWFARVSVHGGQRVGDVCEHEPIEQKIDNRHADSSDMAKVVHFSLRSCEHHMTGGARMFEFRNHSFLLGKSAYRQFGRFQNSKISFRGPDLRQPLDCWTCYKAARCSMTDKPLFGIYKCLPTSGQAA